MVFLSQANNLVTNDDKGFNLDIFLHDIAKQRNTLVSVSTNAVGGANRDSNYPSVSSNGLRVAFSSRASNLVAGDTNNLSDVFVRDLSLGTTILASVAANNMENADGHSTEPLISADGRWVVFTSEATNLLTVEFATHQTQVYARDLELGRTFLVSVKKDGPGPGNASAVNPSIGADGRLIAFVSTATNLADGATNVFGDIFVRDILAGTTIWASSNAAAFFTGTTNGYRCLNPTLSTDGSTLAFKGIDQDTQLVKVFCHDLAAGITTCVSTDSIATTWPQLSDNGCYLAYEAQLYGMNRDQIYVWDKVAQTNILISARPGSGNNPQYRVSKTPIIAETKPVVAFISSGLNLDSSSQSSILYDYQLYMRDISNGITRLLTRTGTGEPWPYFEHFVVPAISADARYVAFESMNESVVGRDHNRATDIFLIDNSTGETRLISTRHDASDERTATASSFIEPKGLSADGRYALVSAFDGFYDETDANRIRDIYRLDLHTGTNVLVSAPTNFFGTNVIRIMNPTLSPNGRRIAFLRAYSNYNQALEGHVYDCDTMQYELFNVTSNGIIVSNAFYLSNTPWQLGMAWQPDGRKLVFVGKSLALADLLLSAGSDNLFVRDIESGINRLLSASATAALPSGESYAPRYSLDGRWILFATTSTTLITNPPAYVGGPRIFAYDTYSNQMRFVSHYASNAVFSADGRFIAVNKSLPDYDILFHDLWAENPTNRLVVTNAQFPSVSYDAEVVAFQSRPSNNLTHVFAKDMLNDRLELLSVAPDGVTPGNGPSGPPQIHPFGRYVLFSSKASNLVTNDDNGFTDVFLRDRVAGVTYLLSANPQTGHSGNGPSTSPLMSADGSTILFASHANDLVTGDYNDKQDIFVVKLGGGDSDGDGLDDAWELAYLNTLIYNGDSDPDGDGMSNLKEYRAGTDPTNRGSVLRALVMGQPGGASTTVMWPVAAGKTYQVQYKNLVTDPDWTDLAAAIEITGDTARTTDATAGLSAQRFYRVVLVE